MGKFCDIVVEVVRNNDDVPKMMS